MENEPEKRRGEESSQEKEDIIAGFQKERSEMLSETLSEEMSASLDLVPMVGDGKKVLEAVMGRTMVGKEMTGKERLVQAAVSTGCMAMFFTPVGMAKSLRDVALLAGKSPEWFKKKAIEARGEGDLHKAEIFDATRALLLKYSDLVVVAEQKAEEAIIETFSGLGQKLTGAAEGFFSEPNQENHGS